MGSSLAASDSRWKEQFKQNNNAHLKYGLNPRGVMSHSGVSKSSHDSCGHLGLLLPLETAMPEVMGNDQAEPSFSTRDTSFSISRLHNRVLQFKVPVPIENFVKF